MSQRKKSAVELILGCKEMGCPWDPDAPIFEVQDKLGRRLWMRRIRCMRCGSTKVERFHPRLPLERIGSIRYERVSGWYDADLKFYWRRATAERASRGMLALPAVTSE